MLNKDLFANCFKRIPWKTKIQSEVLCKGIYVLNKDLFANCFKRIPWKTKIQSEVLCKGMRQTLNEGLRGELHH